MAKTSSAGMSTLFSEPTTESSKDSLSGFDSVVTSMAVASGPVGPVLAGPIFGSS